MGRLVHDGRTNVKDLPTLLNLTTSSNVLRNLNLCSTSSANNALVLVDQVGL